MSKHKWDDIMDVFIPIWLIVMGLVDIAIWFQCQRIAQNTFVLAAMRMMGK